MLNRRTEPLLVITRFADTRCERWNEGGKQRVCAVIGQFLKINTMNKLKPIYGTTMSGTETIFAKWMNGDKEQAIKFLVMCIQVNKPETPNNTEQMAKDTIEKWIDDNF